MLKYYVAVFPITNLPNIKNSKKGKGGNTPFPFHTYTSLSRDISTLRSHFRRPLQRY